MRRFRRPRIVRASLGVKLAVKSQDRFFVAGRAGSSYVSFMSVITVEVDIDHGRIVARQPEKLPDIAEGVLTVIAPEAAAKDKRKRVRLPLIHGDTKKLINPTAQELDASLWGD